MSPGRRAREDFFSSPAWGRLSVSRRAASFSFRRQLAAGAVDGVGLLLFVEAAAHLVQLAVDLLGGLAGLLEDALGLAFGLELGLLQPDGELGPQLRGLLLLFLGLAQQACGLGAVALEGVAGLFQLLDGRLEALGLGADALRGILDDLFLQA